MFSSLSYWSKIPECKVQIAHIHHLTTENKRVSRIEQILSIVAFSAPRGAAAHWEMERFCQTVIVQNFDKQLQSMLKVWFLHRNWMKSIWSTIFLPSHVTVPRDCKFLLVLCHWWSSLDSYHRWGLHNGESSSPVGETWNV